MTKTMKTTTHSTKRLTGDLLRIIKSTICCTLFVSQLFFQHDLCLAAPQSTHATSASSDKLGAHMERQPESTIAPLYDEVLFECGLNLTPDRLEWRFRPQYTSRTASYHISNNDNINDFIYLSENVSRNSTPEILGNFNRFFICFGSLQGNSNITTEDGISKLRVYVNQQSVGEYQCVAWFGTAALASVPAKLLLADISLNGARGSVGGSMSTTMEANRRIQPPQVSHWNVSPGNSVLIHCGEVASNPAPVWSFYKYVYRSQPKSPEFTHSLLEIFPLQRQLSAVELQTATTKWWTDFAIGDAI